jgi:hypothetical protein
MNGLPGVNRMSLGEAPGQTGPPAARDAERAPVPDHHGFRLDDRIGPLLPGAAQGEPERSIHRLELHPTPAPGQHRKLLAQSQLLEDEVASEAKQGTDAAKQDHDEEADAVDHAVIVAADAAALNRRAWSREVAVRSAVTGFGQARGSQPQAKKARQTAKPSPGLPLWNDSLPPT